MGAALESSMPRLGRYELVAELASGGMATVYVARHVGASGVERPVVIKRVHPHLLKHREFCDMFRDEARVVSLVSHPNVVKLHDVVDSDGELFLVLEYVEGVSLGRVVKASRRVNETVPAPIVVRIMGDVLAGLHAAHEARDMIGRSLEVVHRDVSPQNILVGVDGIARLIDFGIAKAAVRVTETTGGVVKGKFAYMSPEQAMGEKVDRRSDIFSAGVVLFEALTGKRLFHRDDSGDGSHVLLDVLLAPIPLCSSLVPAVSSALDGVLQKALARPRDERFATAAEFARALQQACPPAGTHDVATYIESLCGPQLAEQREALRRILSGLQPSGVVLASRPKLQSVSSETGMRSGLHPTVRTAGTLWGRLAPRRRRALVGTTVAGVFAGAALATWVAMHAARAARRTAPAMTSSAASRGATQSAPPPPLEAPPPAVSVGRLDDATEVTLQAPGPVLSIEGPGVTRVDLTDARYPVVTIREASGSVRLLARLTDGRLADAWIAPSQAGSGPIPLSIVRQPAKRTQPAPSSTSSPHGTNPGQPLIDPFDQTSR